MHKKEIIFETFAHYSQDQNRVFEKIRRTIIDMTRVTILEKNINNDL